MTLINKLTWNQKFNMVIEYKNKYNKLPTYNTVYKNRYIGKWLHYQKIKYKKNKLQYEKVYKLISYKLTIL